MLVLHAMTLVPGSIAALLLGIHLYAISSPARRQRFSLGPMGLSGKRKKPKKYAAHPPGPPSISLDARHIARGAMRRWLSTHPGSPM